LRIRGGIEIKTISNVIEIFKENLILKQLEKTGTIPVNAFQNISEIENFCKNHNKILILKGSQLEVQK
jgi:hypothetical protein